MSDLTDILETKVSRQENLYAKIFEVSLSSVLGEIKGLKHSSQTEYLREIYNQNLDRYKRSKKRLPVVTFCATFDTERGIDYLKTYNYLLIVDIDNLDKETIQISKRKLLKEKRVFSFWESPSGHGIKALIHLKYEFDIEEYSIAVSHRIAFNQVEEYFKKEYDITIDKSNKDVARACFISHDSGLHIKRKHEPFIVKKELYDVPSKPVKAYEGVERKVVLYHKDILYNPASRNNPTNRRLMNLIINYLTRRSLSITYDYNDWLLVAFAIVKSFTFDVGLKYFISLSKLDKDIFDENNCIQFLEQVYIHTRGEVGFPTIIYKAQQKGFVVNPPKKEKKKKKRTAGSTYTAG